MFVVRNVALVIYVYMYNIIAMSDEKFATIKMFDTSVTLFFNVQSKMYWKSISSVLTIQ
jgi:hypothetical protein